ncbi:MAG: PAS domain S-box protein [Syntrophomonas sp.]
MIETLQSIEQLIKQFTILQQENEKLNKMLINYQASAQALKISEARYRAVVEDQSELICRFLPDSTLTFVNQAYCRYFGLKEHELLGKTFLSFLPEEDRELSIKKYSALTRENPFSQYEHRVLDADGEIAWQEWTDRGIFDNDGTLIEIQSIGRDITRRKLAEEALAKSEAKFRKLAETAPAYIFLLQGTQFLYVNPNMEKLIGYTLEECLQMDLWELVHPAFRELVIERSLARQRGDIVPASYEFKIISKDQQEHWIEFYGDTVEFEGQPAVMGVAYDITKRKQMQDKIARYHELHLIGEMAASIGHEIRNPMTCVRGFLQMVRDNEHHNSQVELFDLMIEELDRANSIITEFLSLAKNKALDFREHNLNSILQTIYPLLLVDALEQNKSLKLELGEISSIMLDEKEIRQLIYNLVRNGFEAMASGGKLLIKTFMEDEFMVMAVQDQGKGIKAEDLEKLGSPFFTTKDSGTGLGLSVCYNIAAHHHANIEIDTSPNGTTFFVRFAETA